MKGMIIAVMVATVAMIIVRYFKTRNLKKLLVLLITLIGLMSLGIAGMITRQILPLFILHLILLAVSWGGILYYLFKDRYIWWLIFSPLLSISAFLLLEHFTGSGHENALIALC